MDCASSQGKPGLELRQDGKEESKPPLLCCISIQGIWEETFSSFHIVFMRE